MNIIYFIIGLLTAIIKFFLWGLWVEIFSLLGDLIHGIKVVIDRCVKRGKGIIKGQKYE